MKGKFDWDNQPPVGECWMVGLDSVHRVTHIRNGCYVQRLDGAVQSVLFVHPTRITETLDEALEMLVEGMRLQGDEATKHVVNCAAFTIRFNEAVTYIKEHL